MSVKDTEQQIADYWQVYWDAQLDGDAEYAAHTMSKIDALLEQIPHQR